MYPSFTEHELKDAIIWLVMQAKDIDERHKWNAMLDKERKEAKKEGQDGDI